jgi:hypothetical protein
MSAEYTPGPWKIGAHESGKMAVDGANGEELTGFIEPADAILIAAAPDLLEAAKLALQSAESWIHDQLDGTSLLESALAELEPVRAAIAKATGGQE